MAPGITIEQCREAQSTCRGIVEKNVESKVIIGLAPMREQLARIETHLENNGTKLDELTSLASRVLALEMWKSQLNGHAKALAESKEAVPSMEELRAVIHEAAKQAVVQVKVRTRTSDGWYIPMWAVKILLPALGLIGATVVTLAAFAGPDVLDQLPWNRKAPTTYTQPAAQPASPVTPR